MAVAEIIKWEDALVSPDATLKDAIEVLNKTKMQIVLVVDEERRIMGRTGCP